MVEQPRVLSWEFRENSATAGLTKINKVASIIDGNAITAPEELIKAAKELLHPNSILTPLCASHEGFLTVQGEVIKVEVSDTLESVEVTGVMETTERKCILNVLLADYTVLEIEENLWEPLVDLLKVNRIVVSIQKVGSKITAVTPIQGQN